MDSIHAFLDATGTFLDHVTDVRFAPLLVALLLHVANLVLRSRAWTTILYAAFPDDRVPFRIALGAYLAGVGVNAFAPARGGDVVKIGAVRRRVPTTSVPTLASSLIAETVFDFVAATTLLAWGYSTGRIPHLLDLPSAPAFEWSAVARHPRVTFAVALVVIIGSLLVTGWAARHARRLWARLAQGLAILHRPVLYLRGVVLFQAAGWLCRAGSAYAMLLAFGVNATVANALVVLVVGSVSTLLPITPGGAGAQQALLAIALAGEASASQVLAYSVGAQVAVTVVNALLGAIALLALFRSLRFRRLHHDEAAPTPA
jgi:uncharacterized membrane protein YbhN (UPF0104 family)